MRSNCASVLYKKRRKKTMENTNLTNEVMEQENTDMVIYDLPEEEVGNSGGFGTKAVVVTVVAGVLGYVGSKIAKKLKPKFEEAKAAKKAKKNEKDAERLRNDGYVVFREEDCEVREVEEYEEVVETTEE